MMHSSERKTESAATLALLAVITCAGLGLRLLAWYWHELYPLGGDEREYLGQALALLRGEGYHELKLMRPPLYAVFLAAGAWLVDGSTQGLRLIQALISTATIPLIYLLTRALLDEAGVSRSRRPALIAAGLTALSYTLALNATELLTETAFLFGLTLVLWLLLGVARQRSVELAFVTGATLGLLCLLRSVALPLLLLGAAWLWLYRRRQTGTNLEHSRAAAVRARRVALLFVAGTLVVILPWTARNALRYGHLILIDTTGQENLWLDNDPRGREAVKRELYAMGEDRGARAALSSQMGLRVIAADPQRFARKAWGELLAFTALEQTDDMQRRPAIWVRPAEVALRLLLGDGHWLVLLIAGLAGLTLGPWRSMRFVLGLWLAYVVLTGMVYHVELRYRLPLYPVLLPAAGWLLGGRPVAVREQASPLAGGAAVALSAAALVLTLLHANYPALAWQLGWKHLHLMRADQFIDAGALEEGQDEALAALLLDDRSALARVALARVAALSGDEDEAQHWLRQAIENISGQPYAHLLLGDLLRRQGEEAAARRELRYETASLEDLQSWAWNRFTTPPPQQIAIGDGLDLGWILGFHTAEDGVRWTTERAIVHLAAPAGAQTLVLRLRGSRPAGAPPARVEVLVGGRKLFSGVAGPDWRDLALPLPAGAGGDTILVEIRSSTVRPHDFDRTSPDGRLLGVQVDEVRLSSDQ